MHARRIRPDAGALDRRRLAAAVLSAILPGLGQLFNGRRRLAAVFLFPSLVLLALALLAWVTQTPARLAAMSRRAGHALHPACPQPRLLALRLSASQAFLDTRWHGPTGRLGVLGLVVIVAAVILPHVIVHRYGTSLRRHLREGVPAGRGRRGDERRPAPPLDERINVLLVGVDKLPLADDDPDRRR